MKMKLQNAIRKNSLSSFGFGIDAMKKLAVCPNCHALESSENTICSVCKGKLSKLTLFDVYKSKHKTCPACGTVIAKGMQFCPHCGQIVNSKATVCSV